MNKSLFRIMIVVALSATTISFASAQGIKFEEGTFAEALEKAKQEGKLLFMDCYTSWCGPCKMLANNVFTNDTIGQYFNRHFINLKMDMEKGEGPELERKYSVKAYPTLLFIEPSSQTVVYQAVGGRSVQGLLEESEKANDPNRNLQGLALQYEQNPTHAPSVLAYLNALKASSLTTERDGILNAYLSNIPQDSICSKENWAILATHTDNPYSSAFDFLHKYRERFRKAIGKENVDGKLDRLYRYAIMPLIRRKRIPESEFPQEKFDKLVTLLHQEEGQNFAYYQAQLDMIGCVQKGDYNAMLNVLDKAEKGQILTQDTRFYFIWLNLTYLKECNDKRALERGLVWMDKIKSIGNEQAWQNMRKALMQALNPN